MKSVERRGGGLKGREKKRRSEGRSRQAGWLAVEESVRWPSMAAMEDEPDQTWQMLQISSQR